MKEDLPHFRDTPDYYIGKYKCIEAMDVVMDFQRDSYNLGVAIAYLLRAGHKPNNPKEQDIKKAIDHLQAELDVIRYEKERDNDRLDLTKDDKSQQPLCWEALDVSKKEKR